MGFMVTAGTRQGENPVYGNFCNYGFLRCVQNDFVLKETGENVYAVQNAEFVLLFRQTCKLYFKSGADTDGFGVSVELLPIHSKTLIFMKNQVLDKFAWFWTQYLP